MHFSIVLGYKPSSGLSGGDMVPLSDTDLERAARSLIAEFGDGAKEEAEGRSRSAEAGGRTVTASYWKRIAALTETISKAK